MSPRAPRPDRHCSVCTKPLISVRDDPSDAHPTCDPVDRDAWERFLRRDTTAEREALDRGR